MWMQNAPNEFVSKRETGESARCEVVVRGGRVVEMVANRQVVLLGPA
jgi:hypothetical protein